MSARLALACATFVACGPSTSGTGSSEDTGDTSSSASSESTGPPPCTPRASATIVDEHRHGNGGIPSDGEVAFVAGDGAGNLVTALTDGSEDDDDVLVIAFDPSGAQRWSVRYEGMAGLTDTALGVAVDDAGNVYALVREQTVELLSEGFGNRFERTLVVLAIGSDGAPHWRYDRMIPAGEGSENAREGGIAIGSDGRVIVVDLDASGIAIAPPSLTELDRFGNELVRVDIAAEATDITHVAIAAASDDVLMAARPYGDTWIARIARDGTMRWESRVTDGQLATAIAAGKDDSAWALVTTGDAEAGTAGFELRRFDAAGTSTTIFAGELGSAGGYPAGLVIDCDGTVIIATELQDGPSQRSAWLGAVTPDGELAWSTALGDARAPRSLALIGDADLAIGGLDGTTALGPWVARLAP